MRQLQSEIEKNEGVKTRQRYSPGYFDLDITEQKKIFAMMDITKRCGITLSGTCQMIPTKSVTAFAGFDLRRTEMKIKFFDGSMGTMLQGMGLAAGELPELLNITDSEKVLSVHRAYAAAGSEYITTNTSAPTGLKLKTPRKSLRRALRLAKSTGKRWRLT